MSVTSLDTIHNSVSFFTFQLTFWSWLTFWLHSTGLTGKVISAILKGILHPGLYHNLRFLHGARAQRGTYTVPTRSPLSYLHRPSNSWRSLMLLCQFSAWESISDCPHSICLDAPRAISLWCFLPAVSLIVLAGTSASVSKLWTSQIFSFLPSKTISVCWGRSLFFHVSSETCHLHLGILSPLLINFLFKLP